MNNTINCNYVSFNSRSLRIKHPDEFPVKVYAAIYKSDSIEQFLSAGRPKTLWGKIIDLFKRNEKLDIYYGKEATSEIDPYAKKEWVNFVFNKKIFPVRAEQKGIKRKQGSIPKMGEHHTYLPPMETSTEKLIKQIEDIKDLDKQFK